MTRNEAGRRLLHAALGAGAFAVPLIPWPVLALASAAAAAGNAWVLPRLAWTRWLLREGGDGGRRGLVLYPVAVGLLAVVFRDDPEPIQAGWLALALGDGLAPFFGALWPAPRWPWNPRKSVTASVLAFAVAAALIAGVVPLPRALAAAAAGLLGESLPAPVEDNLSVPALASGAVWMAAWLD